MANALPISVVLRLLNQMGPTISEAKGQLATLKTSVAGVEQEAVMATPSLEGMFAALEGIGGVAAVAGVAAIAAGVLTLGVTAVAANSRLNQMADAIKGRGVEAMHEFQQQAMAVGMTVDDLTARRFVAFKQATDENTNAWKRLGDEVALNFLPMSNALATALGGVADQLFKMVDGLASIGSTIAGNKALMAIFSGGIGSALLGPAGLMMGALASFGPRGAASEPYLQGAVTRPLNYTDDPAYKAYLASGAVLKGQASGMASWAGMTQGPLLGRRDNENPTLVNLKKLLEVIGQVPVPALRAADSMKMFNARMDAGDTFVQRMGQAVAQDFTRTINDVVTGARSIGDAFVSLIQNIMQSLEAAAAQYAIGLGLQWLGTAMPGPFGVIAGIAGKNMAGGRGAQRAGTTIVNVNALSAKDIVRSMSSPSGELRQAGMRTAAMARLP